MRILPDPRRDSDLWGENANPDFKIGTVSGPLNDDEDAWEARKAQMMTDLTFDSDLCTDGGLGHIFEGRKEVKGWKAFDPKNAPKWEGPQPPPGPAA